MSGEERASRSVLGRSTRGFDARCRYRPGKEEGSTVHTKQIKAITSDRDAVRGATHGTRFLPQLARIDCRRRGLERGGRWGPYELKRAPEGAPETYNHFPTGWAAAFSAPFKMFKRYSQYAGGTNDRLVISWPAGIKARGELRHQHHHSVHIVPTLLEVLGLDFECLKTRTEVEPEESTACLHPQEAIR